MKEKLQENVFVTIGKLITTALLRKALNKATREAGTDMNLKTTLESLKYHNDELERILKSKCKTYPDSPGCKDKASK